MPPPATPTSGRRCASSLSTRRCQLPRGHKQPHGSADRGVDTPLRWQGDRWWVDSRDGLDGFERKRLPWDLLDADEAEPPP